MKNVIMTIDTECPGLKNPVYDIGWQIHDRKGNVLSSFHALVEEVITCPQEMRKAFFASKIYTDYIPMLNRQDIRVLSWVEIANIMRDQIATYNVNVIAAYNLGFDLRALRLTNAAFGDGQSVFSKKALQLDLWQFACEVIMNTDKYRNFAKENGWVSPAGNVKTNAECVYRYITGEVDFIEDHTALSDAVIETEIAARCYARKKPIPYGVKNAAPWMIVNQKSKAA